MKLAISKQIDVLRDAVNDRGYITNMGKKALHACIDKAIALYEGGDMRGAENYAITTTRLIDIYTTADKAARKIYEDLT